MRSNANIIYIQEYLERKRPRGRQPELPSDYNIGICDVQGSDTLEFFVSAANLVETKAGRYKLLQDLTDIVIHLSYSSDPAYINEVIAALKERIEEGG